MNYKTDADHLPGDVLTKRAGAVFGFEDFWPKVYAQCKQQFHAIDDLIRLANEMVHLAEDSAAAPVENVTYALTGATLTGACEVVLLCGNGCGVGAMKIVRGMYESRWTAEYLRRHPKEVEDYLEFSKILLWRRLNWTQGYNQNKARGVSSNQMKKAEDEYNRVKARFTDGKGRVRFQWSKKTIGAIAKEIGREKEYDLPYAIACSIHHANFEGLSALFASDGGAVRPDPPPSEAWIRRALLAAHVNLWFALSTLNESCGLNFDQKLDAAQQALSSVWKE
jgi:hypothetical protein